VIDLPSFEIAVLEAIGRDLNSNPAQREAIGHSSSEVLMLVAGPGSGKTSVLVLRALRHVFVDGIMPENILLTTFTVKAAKELRTRWLDWGEAIVRRLQGRIPAAKLEHIDLNRCRIGTLDSIAEQTLRENRSLGKIAPIVIDSSAAQIVFNRNAFSPIFLGNEELINGLLTSYTFDGKPPGSKGDSLRTALLLCNRLIQDRANLELYASTGKPQELITRMLRLYSSSLEEKSLYDFSHLELELLNRLHAGTLNTWEASIKALLIDEYQDTNPLQEAIYFSLIKATDAKCTIVGDDDQSMYRFRGGAVELFTAFKQRCSKATGCDVVRVDMLTNYRSTEDIVEFYNSFISADPKFEPARIVPKKPFVYSVKPRQLPVLGLFRESPEILAQDLAAWISELYASRKVRIPGNPECEIALSEQGDLGDMLFVAHSVAESRFDRFESSATTRFPGMLRMAMKERGHEVFNPRGFSLRTTPNVQKLLGLILLCLDPDESKSNSQFLTKETFYYFKNWRACATEFVRGNPKPNHDSTLQDFVNWWGNASSGATNIQVPNDWPVLELMFTLVAWIPEFQNDPEHQVWLEAIARTFANVGAASSYGMLIYSKDPHRELSRMAIIRDALASIAQDEVEVDEEIMPSVPRNRLHVMTIHQSKGLEYPVVIVDVGSHFKTDHHSQRFLRFPENPSNVVRMESDLEATLESPLRGHRTDIDRTFDDLVRLYYVAYSRARCVLLLVGCENCLKYGSGKELKPSIPNIALSWTRDREWPWRQPYTGKKPPIRVEPPLRLIH
jgi:DNA helicase II / ATP-dependent DNA helicase PcrA